MTAKFEKEKCVSLSGICCNFKEMCSEQLKQKHVNLWKMHGKFVHEEQVKINGRLSLQMYEAWQVCFLMTM